MSKIDLFYCADANARLADIAINAGIGYGARLPGTVKRSIQFADQDWKHPDLARYAAAVEKHRPQLATVLDWEHYTQFEDVMGWAETIAPFIDTLIIIPKVWGAMDMIPTAVGGKPVRLGIPCGPAQHLAPPIWEFGRRAVHVLGGQPHRQMALARYLNVVSVDCSVTAYMARLKCAYWTPVRERRAKDRWWAQLGEVGLGDFGKDSYYEAFARSCEGVVRGWKMFQEGRL